ncbi:MAG: M1 family metallopeptidase [Candidatus Levybacteria bacterium]|nr:M1 family metallopeptidase [Candidatus Levybacteria bacterium]
MAKSNKKSVRLPEHIVPKRYKITLAPDLKKFNFTGEVEILLELQKAIKEITLHAAELKITSATLHHATGKHESKNISYDEKLETITLSFGKTIQVKEAKLNLKFSGILNDKMRGFYKSKYGMEGREEYLAVTQFESTDARRAFPSFDEPAKKAVFDVSLIVPQDHTVISNTIEREVTEHKPGLKIVKFESTPKMSTYLLAFIVGKFEHIEVKAKRTLVRVFTTPGKKHQAQFALQTAKKCLEFYEDYFGIPYPLPSLDLIAIPDFAAGAMENWGAITYRETAILVDPKLTSTANKQWVALVIAHELAHMWFGNLVTMEWWTHLWLNEGFASYIEYLAVDRIFPKWHIWTQFVYMDHAKALELDGLKSTHPIEVPVHHPAEISEIFDTVSYSKGASIIRMLASFLGAKNFQKGLQNYLKKHQYENTTTLDLWVALEETSGKKVRQIMKNWTSKPGYPLINVLEKKNNLKLTQSRFFPSPLSAKSTKDKTLWSIPLDSYLFSTRSFSIPKPNSLIKLNRGETSFVRIQYPSSLLKKLSKPIKEKTLGPEDRFGLVRDVLVLSQAGKNSIVDYLKLVHSYKNEDNYIVWTEIASGLQAIGNLIYGSSFYESYKTFCRKVFKPIAMRVGWNKKPNESHFQTLLRSIVLYGLGANGDGDVIKTAQELFKKAMSGKLELDSDLRGVVYNLVAKNGGEKEYGMFKGMYFKTLFQEEKDRILRALCSFENEKLLSKTLEFAFSDKTRAQDRFKAVRFVWANPKGRDLAWNFVKANWESISRTFGGGHLYSRFIEPASYFVDGKKAIEIENFFKKNSSEGLQKTIAQVTEKIRTNSLWIKRDKNKLSTYLR